MVEKQYFTLVLLETEREEIMMYRGGNEESLGDHSVGYEWKWWLDSIQAREVVF